MSEHRPPLAPQATIPTKPRHTSQSYIVVRRLVWEFGYRMTGRGQSNKRKGGGWFWVPSAWSFVFKIARQKLAKHKGPSKLVLYIWPQLTTPKLGSLSQAPPGQWPYFLILSLSSLGELWDRIKNGFNCMGRSWDMSSPNLEVEWMREFWLFLLKGIWNSKLEIMPKYFENKNDILISKSVFC